MKSNKQAKFSEEHSHLWRVISLLPVSLGVSIASFGIVNIVLLLLQSFRTDLILGISLPVALIVFVITNRIVKPSFTGATTERRLFDVLAILFVIAWSVFNIQYNAQTVYLYRDPGLYNTTARWLMDNNNIDIPSINPFGENELLATTSNAGVNMIKEDPDSLYTHGQRTLPTYTATTGRITQESAALKTNIAIGAAALLAVYGFIRLLARPSWAFISTTILGLTLPMLYFSRDMYTEPLAMLFFFTALSLIYFAQNQKNNNIWLVAGLLAGATTLTRIDAFLGLAGIFAFLFLYLALENKKQARKRKLSHLAYFFAGLLVTAIIAWLDLTQLGTSYFRFHEKLIYQQLILLASIVVGGIIFVAIAWKFNLLQKIKKFVSIKRLKILTVISLSAIVTILIARPIFINETRYYEVQEIGGTQSIVVQENKTENSITYDVGEPVIAWPTWYLGIGLCLIAILGLYVMSVRLWNGDITTAPFSFSFLSVTILYFMLPSITPDHIWATRRILPVIIPGILLLFAYLMSQLHLRNSSVRRLLSLAVIAITLIGVINTSGFFVKETENADQLTQINDFCAVLPDNSAVLLVGIFGLVGTQTVHSYCQVPTVRQTGQREPTQEEYVDFYNNAVSDGYNPVVAMFVNDKGLLPQGSFIKNLEQYEYQTVEKVFETYPKKMVPGNKEIIYGLLNSDGVARLSYE